MYIYIPYTYRYIRIYNNDRIVEIIIEHNNMV